MRVALVSDTHGYFDEALTQLFAGADLVLHGGDVVGRDILLLLSAIAPVTAVRGNNDRGELGEGLPEEAVLQLDGLKALILHQLGKPERPVPAARKLLAEHRPDLVIYGHSHVPSAAVVDGVLFVNPGAAGKRRFKLPRTAAILTVSGRRARVEIFEIDKPGLPHWKAPLEAQL